MVEVAAEVRDMLLELRKVSRRSLDVDAHGASRAPAEEAAKCTA